MNKNHRKTASKSIYDKYRKILENPELTEKEVEEMRHNLRLVATAICEHVWQKKFH